MTSRFVLLAILFAATSSFAGNPKGCPTPPGAPNAKSPKMPPQVRARDENAKWAGTVVLQITVGPDGNVRASKVMCSINKELDSKAVEAVQKWHFPPFVKDGQATSAMYAVEVNFWRDNQGNLIDLGAAPDLSPKQKK